MQNFWNVSMVIAGTFIGAGFATGQEINQYFLKYGKTGIFGLYFSSVLFAILCMAVLCKICKTKASNPQEYFGENFHYILKTSYKILSIAFMFIIFCTMITASGEIFKEQFGLPSITGILFADVICVVCFKKGADGLVAINKLLTPLIIVTILVVFFLCVNSDISVFSINKSATSSSIIYVSYNSICLISVLTAISDKVNNKTTAVLGALTAGILLLISSSCLWYILELYGVRGSIPVLNALHGCGKLLYIPVLFSSLITTAVSNGFGVIKEFKNKKVAIILLLLLSYVISLIGIERLVAQYYSLFGYFGLIVSVYILIDGIKFIK